MSFDRILSVLLEKVESWFYGLVAILPNLLVAVLVMVVFYLIARYVTRLLRKVLERAAQNQEIGGLLGGIAWVAIFTTGFFIALDILQLDRAVMSLLAGVGILGLALGFAFQDIASNFVSGIIMAIRHPFKVEDLVEINGYFGRVSRIGIRTTWITRPTGQLAIIPNQKVLQNPILNYSELGERRVDLEVGISYGDDLERAKHLSLEAVNALELRDPEKPVELFYDGFGSSSINFTVRFWIPRTEQPDYYEARSQAVMAIKRSFDAQGITIPFPIRTLDFSEVGGDRLDQMWPASVASPAMSSAGRDGADADRPAATS
jgi:small conductance mechanosensitive channel